MVGVGDGEGDDATEGLVGGGGALGDGRADADGEGGDDVVGEGDCAPTIVAAPKIVRRKIRAITGFRAPSFTKCFLKL